MERAANRKQIEFLRWFPRLLLIAYAFVELFFPLGQFQNSGVGFLLNRLPTFIILAIAAGTWKHLDWAPKVLVMTFIPFLMMFSLDVFSEHLSFWETALALFMHNIPALILTGALVFVWKRELAGAVIFGLAGVALFLLSVLSHARASMTLHTKVSYFVVFVMPPIMTCVLFLCNWARRRLADETRLPSPATISS